MTYEKLVTILNMAALTSGMVYAFADTELTMVVFMANASLCFTSRLFAGEGLEEHEAE